MEDSRSLLRSMLMRLGAVGVLIALVATSRGAPPVLYRANLHCHTEYSDGYSLFWPEGVSPATAYEYAYTHGLNALAVTDHGEMLNLTEWQASKDAALYAVANYWPFLAVHGFEWTGTYYVPDTGHMNVLGSLTRVGAYKTGQNTEADVFGTLALFYGWLSTQAVPVDAARSASLTVVAQFNHPTADDGSDHHGNYVMPADARLRDTVALFEMGSWVQDPGNPYAIAYEGTVSDNDTYDPRWSAEYWYRIALQVGWRVAPSNNGDNHLGDYVWHHHFGPPTCTGVFLYQPTSSTTALQRESALLDALRARRTFAAEDRDAMVVVTADAGAAPAPWWMGTACGTPPGSSVALRVQASDPTDRIKNVELLCSDGSSVAQWLNLNAYSFDQTVVLSDAALAGLPVTDAGEVCIYAKVTEMDGELLFAAPIWISRPAAQGGFTDLDVFGSIGPVTFSATLQRTDTAAPLADKAVTFSVDAVPVGTTRTDAGGQAVLDWAVPSAADYTLMAEFAGDAEAAACFATTTVASSMFTSLTTIDRTGTVTELTTLRGYLKRVSDNSWLSGKALSFKIDGTEVGTAVTDASGQGALNWTITPGPTSRTIAAEFAGDAGLMSSRGTATLTAIVWATKMATFDRTARITDRTELKCRLLRSDNTPLYNKSINFYVDGTFVIARPTNTQGYASYPYYTVPDGAGAGTRTILSEWPGNAGYAATSKAAALTVNKAIPYIWVLPKTTPQGAIANLYAYFRRLYDYQKQEGKPVTFRIDGTWIADVTTGSGAVDPGVARYLYHTIEPPGVYTIRCEFGGDAWLDPGYGEGDLTIQ